MSGLLRVAAVTVLALLAFAGNSLLIRLALADRTIDPASFSTLRLAAGAAALWMLLAVRRHSRSGAAKARSSSGSERDPKAALLLALYAMPISFAYTSLSTGTGALVLFGAVQVTMILGGFRAGERATLAGWLGLLAALGGVVFLVAPGIEAPAPAGAALMIVAGVGWGLYSLRGRGTADPLAATASNFAWALVPALLVNVAALPGIEVSPRGAAIATVCGALTSGGGYVLWFAALRHLTALRAASLQLTVPVLAAMAGVLVLGEAVSARLAIAAVAILGGVAITILARGRLTSAAPASLDSGVAGVGEGLGVGREAA